jgi:hypothetical protein
MDFGTIRISWWLPLFLLVLASPGSGAAEERAQSPGLLESRDWTVEQVMAALNHEREPSVSFEETTYSSLLSVPLVVRGLLRFTPPSTLEKEVLEPYRERYTIEGDRVTIDSDRKRLKKTIILDDYPALRSVVESFRAGFTGDAARLTQLYDTSLDGTRHRWTLVLRPRDPAGRSMVEDIVFSGSEGRLSTIVIHAADGDRSVMTLRRGPTK